MQYIVHPPEGLILRKIYGRKEIRPCRDSRCIRTSFPRFISQGAKRRRVMAQRYSLTRRLTSEIRNGSVRFVQVARADGLVEANYGRHCVGILFSTGIPIPLLISLSLYLPTSFVESRRETWIRYHAWIRYRTRGSRNSTNYFSAAIYRRIFLLSEIYSESRVARAEEGR